MFRTGIRFRGLSVYVNGSHGTIRIGSRGEINRISLLFACMGRNASRRLRKALRREGYPSLANESRDALPGM